MVAAPLPEIGTATVFLYKKGEPLTRPSPILASPPPWMVATSAAVRQLPPLLDEEAIQAVKCGLFAQLAEGLGDRDATLLELGLGTGPNLKYYGEVPQQQGYARASCARASAAPRCLL
jgi:hypothetical protein